MKIKKGDQVLIISGKDRGKKGKVLSVLPKTAALVVEGANMKKKHMRAKKTGEKGQIVQQPFPLDVSNAKLICPKCGKPTRTGFLAAGKEKKRICKKCKQEI